MFEKLKKVLKWLTTIEDLDEDCEDYEEYEVATCTLNIKLELPIEEVECSIEELNQRITQKLNESLEDEDYFFFDANVSVDEEYVSPNSHINTKDNIVPFIKNG